MWLSITLLGRWMENLVVNRSKSWRWRDLISTGRTWAAERTVWAGQPQFLATGRRIERHSLVPPTAEPRQDSAGHRLSWEPGWTMTWTERCHSEAIVHHATTANARPSTLSSTTRASSRSKSRHATMTPRINITKMSSSSTPSTYCSDGLIEWRDRLKCIIKNELHSTSNWKSILAMKVPRDRCRSTMRWRSSKRFSLSRESYGTRERGSRRRRTPSCNLRSNRCQTK